MRMRGSITLQLCLVLGLILSLVLYSIRSVRIAEGRVMLSGAAEQSLYSLFAQYDRDLYREYGLLFLDGGYNGRDLQLGALCREAEEAAEYIVYPGKGRGLSSGQSLGGLELTGCQVTGYLLATDNGGGAFRRQVLGIMEDTLGARALEALREQLTKGLDTVEEQEAYWERTDPEGVMRQYRELKGQGTAGGPEMTAGYRGSVRTDLTAESEEALPEEFENPIDAVEDLQKMGLLRSAIPRGASVSGQSLDPEDLPGSRTLQKGMGLVQEEEAGAADRFLLLEYLVENFPCYTSQDQGEGLRYQVEYAIGGKDSDPENLKAVLTRLLLIREASNFIYLMSDQEKSAQADSTALIICTLLLVPEMKDLVSLALKLCWAYGESIMDLRALLQGGKIPLVKDRDSWQLSLGSLAGMLFGLEGESKGSQEGLDYTWYLRLLLCLESGESLTGSLMDLTEHNVRVRRERPDFSLDSCLDVLEIQLTGRVDGQELELTRSYGYDMEE